MKKSVIALWIVAALFLLSAFPMFAEGNIGAGASGIVLAAVLAFVGYSKNRKAKQAAEAEARKQEEDARKRTEEKARNEAWAEAHEIMKLPVAGVTFDNRQRILASLYKESEGVGISGSLVPTEWDGTPAVDVYAEGKSIGNVRKSDLKKVLPIMERVEDVIITIEKFDDDGEKVYNAVASVTFAK